MVSLWLFVEMVSTLLSTIPFHGKLCHLARRWNLFARLRGVMLLGEVHHTSRSSVRTSRFVIPFGTFRIPLINFDEYFFLSDNCYLNYTNKLTA